MPKTWIIIVVAALVAVALFAGLYFEPLLLGEAKLRVGFQPEPPWQAKLGRYFNFTLFVTNDGPGIARDVSISFLMPIGFIDPDRGTRQSKFQHSRIFPGDAVTYLLRVLVSDQPSTLGNHSFSIKVTCSNAPEQLINPEVKVVQA